MQTCSCRWRRRRSIAPSACLRCRISVFPPPAALPKRLLTSHQHPSRRMATAELINPNPVVHERKVHPRHHAARDQAWGGTREPIDAIEIFDHIRDITDPEHPYTLEQLNVVEEQLIDVDDATGTVRVQFTPTVEHCSMATLIGLCIRVKLLRSLPARFKISVELTPGSHSTEEAVNKQLNDKERVAAALENQALLATVDRCLEGSDAAS